MWDTILIGVYGCLVLLFLNGARELVIAKIDGDDLIDILDRSYLGWVSFVVFAGLTLIFWMFVFGSVVVYLANLFGVDLICTLGGSCG